MTTNARLASAASPMPLWKEHSSCAVAGLCRLPSRLADELRPNLLKEYSATAMRRVTRVTSMDRDIHRVAKSIAESIDLHCTPVRLHGSEYGQRDVMRMTALRMLAW